MDILKGAISDVMQGIDNKRGDEFFYAIVSELSSIINADYTFVARIKADNTISETVALCDHQQQLENFEYALKDTPCQKVSYNNMCIHPQGVTRLFPNDQLLIDMEIEGYVGAPLHARNGEVLGLVVAMYKQKITAADRVASIFQFFSGRISAEMENMLKAQELEKKIIELNDSRSRLEERVAERTEQLLKAKVEAEKASETKENFLSTMSHEIRTPMNGVLGMTELLQSTPLNSEQTAYVEALQQSSDTMMAVLNDILDYSKLSSGEIELELVDFEFEPWLKRVSYPFELSTNSNIKVSVNVASNLPKYLKGDITRLHQVLSNLLNNALKFTEQGNVDLTVELIKQQPGQASIKFSIRDTGIGIAAENIDSIFRPFSQEEISTLRHYGGTGLGLSICKNIIELMGSKIIVDSQKGIGSCFSFTLDFSLGEVLNHTVDIPVDNTYSMLRILLVEDNKINQLVVKGQLQKLGVQLSIVDDGQEAVNLIVQDERTSSERAFDMILMDCEMPNMNGYEATKKIREWEREQNLMAIPIFALTAHILEENTRRCTEVGMNGKLTKPIKLSDYVPVFDSIVASG